MRLSHLLYVPALILSLPLLASANSVICEQGTESKRGHIGFENGIGRQQQQEKTPEAVPTPLQPVSKDKIYDSAYRDTYKILSHVNPCSDFFGGASAATEVLNRLAPRVESKRLNTPKVGMTMSGKVNFVINAETGNSYRLFEKAVLNTAGPFYRSGKSMSEPAVINVGSYQPNTREARVFILLHELGHLMRGANGDWLLPNDGDNPAQSRKNSETIESRCKDQLKLITNPSSNAGRSPKQ
jgi:hypothetical protein